MSEEEAKKIETKIWSEMQEKYEISKTQKVNFDQFVDKPWEEIKAWKGAPGKERVTGVELSVLRELGDQITKLPSDLKAHP